jgi:hypothetical protein
MTQVRVGHGRAERQSLESHWCQETLSTSNRDHRLKESIRKSRNASICWTSANAAQQSHVDIERVEDLFHLAKDHWVRYYYYRNLSPETSRRISDSFILPLMTCYIAQFTRHDPHAESGAAQQPTPEDQAAAVAKAESVMQLARQQNLTGDGVKTRDDFARKLYVGLKGTKKRRSTDGMAALGEESRRSHELAQQEMLMNQLESSSEDEFQEVVVEEEAKKKRSDKKESKHKKKSKKEKRRKHASRRHGSDDISSSDNDEYDHQRRRKKHRKEKKSKKKHDDEEHSYDADCSPDETERRVRRRRREKSHHSQEQHSKSDDDYGFSRKDDSSSPGHRKRPSSPSPHP